MPNVILEKSAQKDHFEEEVLRSLVGELRSCFNNGSFLLNPQKIIRFPFVWLWFSYKKIPKTEARSLLKIMEENGLIEIVPFHGVRIKGDNHGR